MKKKKTNKNVEFWHKKFFVVTADVFNTDIGFCINATEKEVDAWVKKMSGSKYADFEKSQLEDWDNSKENLGRMIQFGGGFVILIKEIKDFRNFVAILTHEIVHVTHYLLRNRRTPLNEDTEEVYTYLTECLIRQALNKLY